MTAATSRLFPLEPPYQKGSYWRPQGSSSPVPLTEGPLLARSSGSSRWHRIKSGYHLPGWTSPESRWDAGTVHEAHDVWTFWCGQTQWSTQVVTRSELPADGLPVCGPCEGRALGAGYNGTVATLVDGSSLLFEPDSSSKFKQPKKCPATMTNLFLPTGLPSERLVAKCAACGLIVRLRDGRQSSRFDVEVLPHEPYQLGEPCPFHAWDRLVLTEDGVRCSCANPEPGR